MSLLPVARCLSLPQGAQAIRVTRLSGCASSGRSSLFFLPQSKLGVTALRSHSLRAIAARQLLAVKAAASTASIKALPRDALIASRQFSVAKAVPGEQSSGSGEGGAGGEAPFDPASRIIQDKGVATWLFVICGVVFAIVIIGGTTRLTRSGLSMTDWKFTGEKLPQTEEEWEAEFERYKQFPEYRLLNHQMNVDEFKNIFFWEYVHRMAGRSAGIFFLVPFLYFLARGRIKGALAKRLALALGMGGCQGLIGWWMVKSGLEETERNLKHPRVSPYRLTTHLMSAFAIYSLLLDTAFKVWPSQKGLTGGAQAANIVARMGAAPKPVRSMAMGVLHMAAMTALSGALVAGNQAGFVYNEFPLMGGRIIPQDIIHEEIQPKWKNVFENSSFVQFNHRVLAMSTLAMVTAFWFRARRFSPLLSSNSRAVTNALLAVAYGQVALGILTLIHIVPVHLGVAHQAGALTLLSTSILLLHTLGPKIKAAVPTVPSGTVKSAALPLAALALMSGGGFSREKHPALLLQELEK